MNAQFLCAHRQPIEVCERNVLMDSVFTQTHPIQRRLFCLI